LKGRTRTATFTLKTTSKHLVQLNKSQHLALIRIKATENRDDDLRFTRHVDLVGRSGAQPDESSYEGLVTRAASGRHTLLGNIQCVASNGS